MYVEFHELQDTSRIWVYQSNREFSDEEVKEIGFRLQAFIGQWTRHGDDLRASYSILYNHFIILAVDESFSQVSGCSIDASTHLFRGIEQSLQVELLNKLNTAFRNGKHINVVSLADFQKYVKEERIQPGTTVFNNLVQTKKELETSWEVPAEKSWHRRYFS